MQDDIRELVRECRLPKWLGDKKQPLDFLIENEGAAKDIIEAAYRYARHEPGAHVTLFGTGNPDHIEPNIRAILQPPLRETDRKKIADLVGNLVGVGLDEVSPLR